MPPEQVESESVLATPNKAALTNEQCDAYRPCSLCSRAGAECVTTGRTTPTSTATANRRPTADTPRSTQQQQQHQQQHESPANRRKRRRSASQDHQTRPRMLPSPRPQTSGEAGGADDRTSNAREVIQPSLIQVPPSSFSSHMFRTRSHPDLRQRRHQIARLCTMPRIRKERTTAQGCQKTSEAERLRATCSMPYHQKL